MNHEDKMIVDKRIYSIAVLLVEDHDFQREYVAGLLQCDLGLNVDSAPNGALALEMIKIKKYDLVICDLAMPTMDGIVFIKRLAELSEKPNLIVLSSQSDSLMQLVERLALLLGFHNVRTLSKPFVMHDFISVIKAFGAGCTTQRLDSLSSVPLAENSAGILEGLIRKQFIPW